MLINFEFERNIGHNERTGNYVVYRLLGGQSERFSFRVTATVQGVLFAGESLAFDAEGIAQMQQVMLEALADHRRLAREAGATNGS